MHSQQVHPMLIKGLHRTVCAGSDSVDAGATYAHALDSTNDLRTMSSTKFTRGTLSMYGSYSSPNFRSRVLQHEFRFHIARCSAALCMPKARALCEGDSFSSVPLYIPVKHPEIPRSEQRASHFARSVGNISWNPYPIPMIPKTEIKLDLEYAHAVQRYSLQERVPF
jgi:hypothetical protein